MLREVFGRILIALSLALLVACVAKREEEAGEWLSIQVQAHMLETKTTLSDDGDETSFHFDVGDEMGFFADGILENARLVCKDAVNGSFSGKILVSGPQTEVRSSVDYYAYYPYSKAAGNDISALTATLPATQKAPFDDGADFIVADPITEEYDPDVFPVLTLEFNTHLFAVVKLNVTNTNEAYAGEQILSIGLKSTGEPLAGQFTFSAVDGDVEFTDDPNYLSDQVMVEYEIPPSLDVGVTHSVYAVVNATSYASGSLSLVVNTTNYIFTKTSRKVLRPKTYQMTSLSTVDISSASRRKRVRTLILWGDSLTSGALCSAVQAQLGNNWLVYWGGVPGDISEIIACRQGALEMVTGASDFILPAKAEDSVQISNLQWRDVVNGNVKYGNIVHNWTFRGSSPQLNPLIINGIECKVSYNQSDKKVYLNRMTDGDEVVIPARSSVSTYGSRVFRNADVIVVYMGTNSRPSENRLIYLHDKMKEYLTEQDAVMIVNGFHQSTTDLPQYWKPSYVEAMTAHYGRYFNDQRTEGGGDNAIPLMKEIGQITDESMISDVDWEYINRGDWPYSWFVTESVPGDYTHLNNYGAKVQAILLRRRMAELGLL